MQAQVQSGQPDWWRGGVIYQIYPRSFADSDGDGVGDLPGITARLDHVAKLGVDAVWLSPFFKSPMKDFGYDVSDYRAVDPLFGTLDDFDALVSHAHGLGLKVMIDLVMSHSSDQHPWFQQSRQDRDNPRADWYVWADARPDGTPPNNWLSLFGGSAWQWDSRRGQYYLHNFLTSQPDLNFHNPVVRRQMLDEVEFWLQRGVDGLRLDVVNFYFHDAELRDNPAAPRGEARADGVPLNNPYAWQHHLYDKTRPENLDFLRELRALLDRYPGSTSVGEIGSDDPLGTMAEYTAGGRLHMAYTFNLLTPEFSAAHVRRTIAEMEARIGSGWPCWSIGNHDIARVMTRWGGAAADPALAKVLMAMLLSLRGSVCIYQGEELALTEADIPFERLRDPYGITFWPEFKGRDGCRTPMPWQADAPHAGFSAAEPWLPIPAEHLARAVDRQVADPASPLHAYRAFLAWRSRRPALQRGSIALLDSPGETLLWLREYGGERLLCAFNLAATPVELALPAGSTGTLLSGHGFQAGLDAGRLALPGYGAAFITLEGAEHHG
ncbi:alpha-glucosidase family protein [Chitinimonas koreensis]|uniref:alpha-glucosidase family protein n=1 Tax=Chitinimonas koreensis TaxID=356302 RepID=UPI00041249EC|nr:alpha-glucosidase family protein [Chitinimonas koreensis]QNM98520.1 alpha-glucosidase [Chitinimonas koreensis]